MLHGELLVQSKIQLKHVDPRFAQQAKIRAFGKLGDELIHLLDGDAASLGHPGSLRPRRIGTDVRIETAGPDAVTASAGIGAFGVNTNGALSSLKALISFTSSRSPWHL